jgi:hypothetical protein
VVERSLKSVKLYTCKILRRAREADGVRVGLTFVSNFFISLGGGVGGLTVAFYG